MSRQQINLYQRPPKVRGLQLNAASMAIAALALIGLMTLLIAIEAGRHRDLDHQLQALQSQQQQLTTQLDQLRANLPADQTSQLQREHAQLQQQLHHLQQIRTLMAQQERTEARGFAAQLTGLATHHQPGISLAEIHLLNGGHYIELAGAARPAEVVPQYLQQLRTEPSFQTAKFGPLNLQRDRRRRDLVNFRLGDTATEETAP